MPNALGKKENEKKRLISILPMVAGLAQAYLRGAVIADRR